MPREASIQTGACWHVSTFPVYTQEMPKSAPQQAQAPERYVPAAISLERDRLLNCHMPVYIPLCTLIYCQQLGQKDLIQHADAYLCRKVQPSPFQHHPCRKNSQRSVPLLLRPPPKRPMFAWESGLARGRLGAWAVWVEWGCAIAAALAGSDSSCPSTSESLSWRRDNGWLRRLEE